MKTKITTTGLLLCLQFGMVCSQTTNNNDVVKFTEFGIPSSGAFSLLGASSSMVNSPGFTKDFKIDYVVQDGKILDNIALDAQPFWVFLFKNKSLTQYRDSTPSWLRQLSKVNFSAGTVKKDVQRQFAWSFKLTVQKDPMMDQSYTDSLENITSANLEGGKRIMLLFEISMLEKSLATETDAAKRQQTENKIAAKKLELAELSTDIEKKMLVKKQQVYEKYIEDHWTDFAMDVGGGQLFNYFSPNFDSLNFISNGWGIWINPAMGFATPVGGGKIKLAALVKWIRIKSTDDIYGGINLRYGSSKINAFIEYVYENNNKLLTHTIAYGATYKIDNKKLIAFGLRHQLDKDFALKNLYPVISINWILAKDLFK